MIILGVILAILGWIFGLNWLWVLGIVLAEPLIGIFGADREVTAEGTTYLRITSAGMAVRVLIFVLGIVLAVVGVVFWLLGRAGRPVAGRRAWY